MSNKPFVFHPLEGFKNVYTAQSGKLRCTALRLNDGGLCLYSPIGKLDDESRSHLADLGEVSVLLAPNHYHNKSIGEYVRNFPKARLVCSAAALPRLSKVTGLEFAGLNTISPDLPDNVQILEPQGLKTGEIWPQIKENADVMWIVTDAFTAKPIKKDGYADSPTMLGTFPKYGVRDKAAYISWVEKQALSHMPTHLVPCHGPAVKSANLGSALIELNREYL